MRVLAVVGVLLMVLLLAAAGYAYFGLYNIAATDPHVDLVRWALERARDNSVERHASQDVGAAPALDDPKMIRTGGRHYAEEGCIQCHGGPGMAQAEFARTMRPEPPDLTQAASEWNDAELFWIMQHGIKMTGMPAFGPTHDEHELWAMVAFVRRLPKMSPADFNEITASGEGAGHHAHGDGGHGAKAAGERGQAKGTESERPR